MRKRSAAQTGQKLKHSILGGMLLRLLIQRLFLPTFVLIVLTMGVASYMWDRSLGVQQMELARVLANTVETFLQNAENMLRSAAKVADLAREMPLSFYLESSREGFAYFDTTYRLDKQGIIVQLEPHEPRYMGLDQSRQPFFRKAKSQQDLFISRPFNSMRTGKPTVNMTWPLADGGMMVAELNLGTFQDAVTAARHKQAKSTIIIVDQAGTILAHPRTELIAQQTRIGNPPLFKQAGSGEATMHYRSDGQWMLGSCTRIESTGWAVLVQAPLAVVYGALLKAAVPIVLLCLVIWFIVVLTFRQRFWRHVVAPLADLSQTAIAITSGDLERTAKVEKEDEIGIVAKAFNAMTAQLRKVISRLEDRVDQLTRTREELKKHREKLEELVDARTAELSTAKQQAEAANTAKSDFLARMSHEIRTPLNAVIGLTNIVLKSELTAEQRDYLNKVKMASNNLVAVINDILDFSKVEAGRMELEQHPFDLNQVMEQLVDLFRDQIAEKNVELFFAANPNVPRQLTGDATRLVQVLINLIQNAVKFTQSGEIVVGVEQEGQPPKDQAQAAFKFWVSDTGTGIAADVLPTLFEPFTQAEGYLTRKHEGTGLGLAICRRLVELMGGRIWAESTPGRGSTFSFTVMLSAQKEEKPRLCLPADLHGLKALVVDDSATARQVLCDLLESFHFNVSAVDSGEKAIEALRRAAASEPYRLVLLDWKMPGMDGVETARRIRKLEFKAQEPVDLSGPSISHQPSAISHKPIPIIMVTAYERELAQKRMDTTMVESLLLKPVKPSQLFNAVMGLFGRAEAVVPRREHKPAARPIHRLAGRRVLVVEDSALNRDVAVALLEDAGLVVETAENGRVAVDMATGSPNGYYDAVLMDIQMPVMDGYEATQKIREIEKQQGALAAQPETKNRKPRTMLPIIALTAHALKGEKEKCLTAGMDDYIAKPIDEKHLERVLLKRIISKQGDVDTSNRLQTGGPSDDQTALDIPGALKRLGGRRQIYVHVLKKFAPECGKAHEVIRWHLAANDKETASRMAHNVKGAAAAIGAVRLSTVAAKLETAIKDESPDINVLLSGFNSELEQALKAADRFLKAESEG